MTGREFKDAVFDQFARIAYAFASPKRLEMIDVLAQGERDVDSLARQVGMTIANTSRHLQVLKTARLIQSRREGVRIFYRLADDDVFQCWKNLQSLAENRIAEIREVTKLFFDERDKMEPINRDELWNRIRNHDVTVIDVRPPEEYRQAHIPAALSIPLAELKERLDEIPHEHEVVAYCRGPYCVLSVEAVKILRDSGYKVSRLKDGMPEWKRASLPIE
ncbi:ArsR family transcriptional regulator [candidate division KSB1 bacterium RBG_16_48_16]|nr:MAG: ArsR family transcriptional regulator [candidate division KSB1 bacterium RBG_16_48_16]